MTRYCYSDCTEIEYTLWRNAINAAIRGKRGQAFLREMLRAFDNLPKKELIVGDMINEYGGVCALGAVFQKRGIDTQYIDIEMPEEVAKSLGIAKALVAEITFLNDDCATYQWDADSPEQRFIRMRKWVKSQIKQSK